jgi:hypothetical protein
MTLTVPVSKLKTWLLGNVNILFSKMLAKYGKQNDLMFSLYECKD